MGKFKLKFKDKGPQQLPPCRFCGERTHEAGACPTLQWCHRCGEKGHFANDCPHHTESAEAKEARRKEEKKNWDYQMKANAKRQRTERSWSRGRSATPDTDEDEPCPIPAVDRPFTEEEKERARQRREWFAERDRRRKERQRQREEEYEFARREAEDEVAAAATAAAAKQQAQRGSSPSPVRPQSTENTKAESTRATGSTGVKREREDDGVPPRTMTSALRALLNSRPWQKKVQAQRSYFECPNWATLPDKGLHLEVRRGGDKLSDIQVDGSLYYIFGKNPDVVDFVLDHESISRTHFVLVNDGERRRTMIADLGSKAGTYLDGKKLTPNEMVVFSVGAKLRVGESTRTYILKGKSLWENDDSD